MRIIHPYRDQLSDGRLEVERQYDERYRRYSARHELYARRARLWSWARLLTFTLAAVFLFVALTTNRPAPWGYISIACIAVFLGSVVQHLRARKGEARSTNALALFRAAGIKGVVAPQERLIEALNAGAL